MNKSYATSTAVNPNPEVATAECQAALPVWLPVNPIDGLLSLLGNLDLKFFYLLVKIIFQIPKVIR